MHDHTQHAVLYILHLSYNSSDKHLAKEKAGYYTGSHFFVLNWHRKFLCSPIINSINLQRA